MELRRRRALSLLSLLAVLVILGTGQRYLARPELALAQTLETFSETRPPIVLAGDPSHPGLAVANPEFGLNGYCVRPQSSTTSSVGVNNGFAVSNGQVLSSAKFDNATVATNDDIYCVVVLSDANPPDDPAAENGAPNRAIMRVTWTYQDSNSPGITLATTLDIKLVRVTLQGFDGVVGGRALVCTIGWEVSILTGHKSNIADTLPDSLDKVAIEDWVLTTGGVNKLGNPFKQGTEWCIALGANVPTLDIDIEFHYDATYDPTTNLDDTPQPRPNTGHVVIGDAIVDINEVSYSELRHITIGGQIAESQAANFNTIGARHTACIIPSTAADILRAEDIVFLGAQGEVQLPNVVNLVLFNNPPDTLPGDPSDGHLEGVVAGTWCFTWTSTVAGEQAIYLTLIKTGGQFPGPRFVSWDSNGDGNPDTKGVPTGPSNGALVKKWNRIDKTEVTLGDLQFENIVTNGFAFAPVVFNVADGSYVFNQGSFRLTEWVTGSHTQPDGSISRGLLDGTILVARIDGSCGYFSSEDNFRERLGQVINGVSNNGRFDRAQYPLGPANQQPWSSIALHDDDDNTAAPNLEFLGDGPDDLYISILNDAGCTADSTIVVIIDAYYPTPFGSSSPTLAHTEFVNVRLQFVVNQKSPRIAWVGQIVTINYGFATGSSGCTAAASTVHFIRQADAPGNFIPDGGITIIGEDEATAILGSDCAVSIRYESEQQGEVDIEAFIDDNPFTKIAYPVFYMAIEDVVLTASGPTVVSTFGDVSAQVRGFFSGANQSTRPAEKSPDGRELPAGRWVLPDDWEILRGDGDLRPGWAGSASMPITRVTFLMENEDVVNSYRNDIFKGAAGWFELDGSESSINVNPYTGVPSVLGTVPHPRIITDDTDSSGIATVDSYGDFNLGYQGCDENLPTGNPHCDVGDIVGQTRYYAYADYPMFRGPLPPVTSNTAQTDWIWAGYKTVTIEDTDAASQKYVVVRLRDRDGFCDAINTNNVLGIPIYFRIDAGDGKIVEAQGLPVKYDLDQEGVISVTYDTEDDQGNPMNIEIVRPIHSDTGDECQAWIKLSRSLPGTVNVEILIPASPVAPTGDVRITAMQCVGNETITVTNAGSNPVSLAGYALDGPLRNFGDFPHLGLVGILQPGESKTFKGGPNAAFNGWINSDDTVLPDFSGLIQLVWQNYIIGTGTCSPNATLPPTFTHVSPVITQLPPSGEGEIHLSVNVEFGKMVNQNLVAGWNLIGGAASITPVKQAIAGNEERLTTIYSWDAAKGEWKRYLVGAPEYLNTLTDLQPGLAYWVHARESFTLSIPE